MDTIYINELEVPTHIGITEEERALEQTLRVSVELFGSTKKAGESDAIEDTIDYDHVSQAIKQLGRDTERNTIEKLAEDIADMILAEYTPERVKVAVWKYILPDTRGVCVTIELP